MFKKILVAVDGSDHSNIAINTACNVASHYSDAEILLVHAPMVGLTGIGLGAASVGFLIDDETLMRAGKEILDNAETRARAEGAVSISSKVLKGDPAEAIVKEADAADVDLIIAGRRGMGSLKGLMLGSVSQKLSAHAECPVMTVH